MLIVQGVPRSSPHKTKKKATRNKGSSTRALAGSAASRRGRLAWLERRRKALAGKIARKQRDIAGFDHGCRELGTMLAPGLESLVERGQAVDAEIHAMFRHILTTRKLGKRSYKAILNVYRSLQDEGIISTSASPPGRPGKPRRGETEAQAERVDGAAGGGAEAGPAEEAEDEWQVSAAARTQGTAARRRSIRDMFLQLASQFHPDRVTDADMQRRHTEIMIELNRAYRDGDVARLLEMERELDDRGMVDLRGERAAEDRCAKLEQQIELLEEQLHALDDYSTSLRNSFMGELFREYRYLLKRRVQDPVALLLHEFEVQLASIEEIADFVRQFRDGEMTIKRFLEGPVEDETAISEEDLIDLVESGDLDALIEMLMRAQSRQ